MKKYYVEYNNIDCKYRVVDSPKGTPYGGAHDKPEDAVKSAYLFLSNFGDDFTISNTFIESTIEFNAEEVLTKTVKASGNSGRIYLPPSWVGKEVKVILIKED